MRLKLENIVFNDVGSTQSLILTDLLLFNYIDNLSTEPPHAIEEAFNPPKDSF